MDSSEHGAPDLPLCGKHALVLQPSTLAVPLLSHGWPCVKYILHASTLDLRKMVLRLTVLTNQRFTRSARHAQPVCQLGGSNSGRSSTLRPPRCSVYLVGVVAGGLGVGVDGLVAGEASSAAGPAVAGGANSGAGGGSQTHSRRTRRRDSSKAGRRASQQGTYDSIMFS